MPISGNTVAASRALALLAKQQIAFTADRAEAITELCDGAEAAITAVRDIATGSSLWRRSWRRTGISFEPRTRRWRLVVLCWVSLLWLAGSAGWGFDPGVPPEQLVHIRQRLEMFATEVFTPLSRSDQRVKGLTYLPGLLVGGRRKPMQPMAERLGVDRQGLQQFVTSSTWDFRAVRQRLAVRAGEVIIPRAWVIDDTGFPKDGSASPCVARHYSGTPGKVGNCQIGVSVHALTDTLSCPLSRRVYLPASWGAGQAADPHSAERARDDHLLGVGAASPAVLSHQAGQPA
ncbi:transposase [Streptosporangium roseum]